MIKIFAWVTLILGTRIGYALEMPDGLSGISIGMSIEEFAKLRPKAKWYEIDWVGPLEPAKMKQGFRHVVDGVTGSSDFRSVAFGIRDGRLVTIEARSFVARGSEQKARRRAIQRSIERWGQPQKKAILDDPGRTGKKIAALLWEIEGTEIGLLLPRARLHDEISQESPMYIRLRTLDLRGRPSWKELQLEEDERLSILRANDVH